MRPVELHVPHGDGVAQMAYSSSTPTSPQQGRPEATVVLLARQSGATSAPPRVTAGDTADVSGRPTLTTGLSGVPSAAAPTSLEAQPSSQSLLSNRREEEGTSQDPFVGGLRSLR